MSSSCQLAGKLIVVLHDLCQGLREGGRLLLECIQCLIRVVRREAATDGVEVDIVIVRPRDGQCLLYSVSKRRDSQGVAALRHSLDALDAVGGGPRGLDVEQLPEGIDRNAEAVVLLSLPRAVALRLL